MSLGKFILQLAAHHPPDDLIASDLLDGLFAGVTTIAQNGYAVCDGKNLVEPMADVKHANAAAFQVADNLEESVDFV